ncbi:ROK family protein [Micromonospora sp. DT68]|uniref:ROK family protein n=1 Tax=Micromonospora TaxID=1873 RepID=UPI0006AE27C0|nr:MULTISPECIES: ROK family protein [Micromonospora]KOX05588.1 ROK family transcriptional regulator [Micromonospora sp. NRRL B-16802]NJC14913.1 glucokinase [Micromonospora profundi]
MEQSANPRLLGIDFGGTKMAIGVGDADGRLLVSERLPTHAEHGAQQALTRALDRARELADRTGGTLVAAGIASPGVVHDDSIDLAPNVPGWEQLRLADAVRDHLGLTSVRVSNDLNAAAYAELRFGALQGVDPGLVIGLGTGVAAAVTVGGEVMPGYHGAAGEIAYGLTDHSWPAGLEPMLEATFSGRALDELALRLGMTGQAAALCTAAAQPGQARDELRRRVDELARQLVTCCLLLDPQRIVLVGSVAGNEVVREMLIERLNHALPYRPDIVLSTFAQDAALLGSLVMAMSALPAPV